VRGKSAVLKMSAEDIGPTWGDWFDAASCVDLNTNTSVISRTDSNLSPDLILMTAIKGFALGGSHGPHTSAHARPVTLALQGGGSLGAFAWGVLDRLLEVPDLRIEVVRICTRNNRAD
jgi:hypothetical protein